MRAFFLFYIDDLIPWVAEAMEGQILTFEALNLLHLFRVMILIQVFRSIAILGFTLGAVLAYGDPAASTSNPFVPNVDLTPWLEKNPNAGASGPSYRTKSDHQECGQDCLYQRGNEHLILQGRYLQHKVVEDLDTNGTSQKTLTPSEMVLIGRDLQTIRNGILKDDQTIKDLESQDDKGNPTAKSTFQDQADIDAEAKKTSNVPFVETSDQLAKDLVARTKAGSTAVLASGKSKMQVDYANQFDISKNPINCDDFVKFNEVPRDPNNAGGDKIWVPVMANGKPVLDKAACDKAKADFAGANPTADIATRDQKIDVVIKRTTSVQAYQMPQNGQAPKLDDTALDLNNGSSVKAFVDAREDVAQAANKGINKQVGLGKLTKGTVPKSSIPIVNTDNTLIPLAGSGTPDQILLVDQALMDVKPDDPAFKDYLTKTAVVQDVTVATSNPSDPKRTPSSNTSSQAASSSSMSSGQSSSNPAVSPAAPTP